jgi:hypothetical protein
MNVFTQISFFAILTYAALAAGASHAGKTPAPPEVPPMEAAKPDSGHPTLEALVEDAIAKLNTKDTAALARLSFGREEFLRAYPLFESDTSRMRREFACNYYLADNRKLLTRRLDQEGGKSLQVERIQVEGNRNYRKGFELSQGLKIWVRDGEREYELCFLKSAAKTGNGWKIWSFEDS